MTPSRLLLPVGVLALLGVATPAPAQFGPAVRFNYQFGLSPAMSFNPYAPFLPTAPGRYSYHGYTLTGVGGSGPYVISYGYYRNAAVVGGYGYGGGLPGTEPSYGSSYGSGFSSGGKAGNQRAAIAAAQKQAKMDAAATAAPNADLDKWVKDVAARREAKDATAAVIDAALVNPPEESITNGVVLNDLVVLVRELEKKRKAKPGLLAPELTTKIVFAGGPAADAANLFRTAELKFPTALSGDAHVELRAELEKAFAVVAKEVLVGKKATAADADRLLRATIKARTDTKKVVANAPLADAAEVNEFFTKLEAAAKYVKGERSAGVAGTNWATTGATVAELVQHQDKFGLTFGPARDGDEGAYFSLHRGLLAYYAALSQAK